MKTYYYKRGTAIMLFIMSCLLCFNNIFAQTGYSMQKGTVYLVRHAEKDSGNNPKLILEGYRRSGDLMRLIKSKGKMPDRIYVNQFRRTQLTADSIRINEKVDTAHYLADKNGDALVSVLLKNKKKDKRILIIGHSNTIPIIIQKLGIVNYPVQNIPDGEYDNFYTITYRKGKAFLTMEKFGRQTLPIKKYFKKVLQ